MLASGTSSAVISPLLDQVHTGELEMLNPKKRAIAFYEVQSVISRAGNQSNITAGLGGSSAAFWPFPTEEHSVAAYIPRL